MLTPPRNQSNSKHAATFFFLSLVVLVLPLFIPSGKHAPKVTSTAVVTVPELSPSPTRPTDSAIVPGGLARGLVEKPSVEEPIPAQRLDDPDAGGLGFDLREKMQSVCVSLLVIAVLVFVLLKSLQKFWPGAFKPGKIEISLMNVLAQQTIAPGVHLSLVQVCNKNVLIGFTEHNVSVLCEITNEEMDKARELQSQVAESPSLPVKTPSEVYREIFNRYLSIFPGFGAKR